MAVHLREANLAQDEAALVAMAQTYLGITDQRRFHWLYRDAPFGPARVWLAFDGSSETPFGMAGLFPRVGFIAGEQVRGGVLGDFCIGERYRSLGPAIKLQRACLSAIQSGEFGFAYDFPSSTMLGIYRYMGVVPTDSSIRMVKPLQADEKVRDLVRMRAVGNALAKAADFALALRDRGIPRNDGMDYQLDEQPCSSEYLRLAERTASSLGNCILRSPEYLNWRYRQHPSRRYEFLTCHRDEELVAYCIFLCEEQHLQIVDLFGSAEEVVLNGMLKRLARLARSRGKSAVSISVVKSDARMRTLRRMGFYRRDSAPVIGLGAKLDGDARKLILMHGDRES